MRIDAAGAQPELSSLRRISWASSWTLRILLSASREIRNLQRHFAREQQRRDRALEFVTQSLLYLLPDQPDFLLVPMQCRPQLTRDPVHVVDGKVHVNRHGGPNVLQYHVALDRFGFEECLIDEHGHIFLGAQVAIAWDRSPPRGFLRK